MCVVLIVVSVMLVCSVFGIVFMILCGGFVFGCVVSVFLVLFYGMCGSDMWLDE